MHVFSAPHILHFNFSFLEEQIVKPLSAQQKKVFLVAMAIFSVIASAVLIYRHCLQAKKPQAEVNDMEKTKLSGQEEEQQRVYSELTKVCFLASHGGPAVHFAAFSKALDRTKYQVSVLATGTALAKFQEQQVQATEFNPNQLNMEEQGTQLAREVAKTCATAQIVITDVGHPFSEHLHEALEEIKSESPIVHLAYYDNPEDLVLGGYSKVAARVMKLSDGVLFANANLAKQALYEDKQVPIDLSDKPLFGIGYYPLEQAKKIRQKRLEKHEEMRANFLQTHGFSEKGQKILAYFGGNNSEYFDKALPKFLECMEEASKSEDFSNTIIVIQQHPNAKAKNEEQRLLKEKNLIDNSQAPSFIFSNFSSDDAIVLADAALYYQTSMGPQFVLAYLPVMQIGHETYEDILVKNQLCSSTTSTSSLIENLNLIFNQAPKNDAEIQEKIWKSLGISKNYMENLQNSLESFVSTKR